LKCGVTETAYGTFCGKPKDHTLGKSSTIIALVVERICQPGSTRDVTFFRQFLNTVRIRKFFMDRLSAVC
jgi:hypothetical protein